MYQLKHENLKDIRILLILNKEYTTIYLQFVTDLTIIMTQQ